MIIDLILDRRDDLKHGIDNYDPREFYQDIVAYEDSFKGLSQAISIALDTGEEEDVKAALKQYIDDQEYNEDIKDFIDSVSWLNEDITEFDIILKEKTNKSIKGTESHEEKNMNNFEKTIEAPVALSNEQLIELAGYLFEAAVEGNEMFSDNPGLDLVENLASWTGIEISLLKDMFDGYIYDEADDDIDSDVLPPNGIDEPILETNQLKEKHGAPLDTSKRPKVRRVKHWHSFLEEFGVDEGHYDFYCKKGDFFIAQTEPKTLIHLGAVDTVAFNTKDEPVKLEDIGLDRDFLLRMEK